MPRPMEHRWINGAALAATTSNGLSKRLELPIKVQLTFIYETDILAEKNFGWHFLFYRRNTGLGGPDLGKEEKRVHFQNRRGSGPHFLPFHQYREDAGFHY